MNSHSVVFLVSSAYKDLVLFSFSVSKAEKSGLGRDLTGARIVSRAQFQ